MSPLRHYLLEAKLWHQHLCFQSLRRGTDQINQEKFHNVTSVLLSLEQKNVSNSFRYPLFSTSDVSLVVRLFFFLFIL